ncbi:MAG: hypothetical protein JXA22_00715 [Candidatus Thermoplasmatota archaeon]|nr:hypothetical protein [Candidatus Thermoplasmatota archaeon]
MHAHEFHSIAVSRPSGRPGKEELRSKLRSKISEIPLTRIDDRVKVHLDLKRITSLEIDGLDTTSSHRKRPDIDEIIAEMEAEIERMG